MTKEEYYEASCRLQASFILCLAAAFTLWGL
jgi:hypothetical protein